MKNKDSGVKRLLRIPTLEEKWTSIMLYRKLSFLSIILTMAFNGQSQQSLSLSDAIQTGLENNYQVKIEETQVDIAQNRNDWGVAGKWPTIDFVLSSNNGYNNINNPISFIPKISAINAGLTPSLNLSWVLFDGYRVRFTKEQLELQERQSQVDVKIAVEQSIQNIILAYYNALLQKEQLDVVSEVLELSRDRINYENVRKDFGQSVRFNVLQTTDAYLNDSTNYLLQRNNYENALRSLNLAMGVEDASVQYALTENFVVPAEDYALANLRERMLANNYNLQNLQLNRELANVGTKIQESTKSPTLALSSGLSYNWNLQSGSGTTTDGETREINALIGKTLNYSLGVTLSYNIFDSGVRNKNIQNAQLNEITVQYGVEDFKRGLNNQLENTLATFKNQKQVVQLTENLLENARENLGISRERFDGGLISSFDYRTVQLNFINASQARLNAIFNLKNTETELIRLIGGLVR